MSFRFEERINGEKKEGDYLYYSFLEVQNVIRKATG